jgi:regulation of enolase protein 1 (concanavalin A-like superfamily)
MTDVYLREGFTGPALHSALRWYCEPARWSLGANGLRMEPEAGTDFWQRTHYGFQVDNGHVLFAEMAGDFVLSTHVRFRPVHQYDQAGLIVRFSAACWLKTSVEYEPDRVSRLGAVVTNQAYSDWSTQPFPAGTSDVWLRVRRERADYIVDASSDGRRWEQIRMAHLDEDRDGAGVRAGLYACSPKGAGFVAEFTALSIERGTVR